MKKTTKPRSVRARRASAPKPGSESPPSVPLGEQIRALRDARRITLAGLAAATGKSIGYVSQIERNQSDVSISTLKAIADALGVRISWFFQGEEADRSRESPYVVRREHRQRLNLPGGGVQEELLSPTLNGESELILSTFAPGAGSGDKLVSRMAEQSGLLMSGELELQIASQHFTLRAGDAFRIGRGEPFTARNTGLVPAISLWVITPPLY